MTRGVRVVLSILLGIGFFMPLAIADELLTSPGHRQIQPASSLLLASYLLLAQFLVARKGRGLSATRPTLIGMVAPVAGLFLLSLADQKQANMATEALWWFLACSGAPLGAALAALWKNGNSTIATRPERGGVFWAPRVLVMVPVVLVAMPAINVFHERLGFWQTILGLAVHLISALCVIVVLVIAWRWEGIGAILIAAAGPCFVYADWWPFPGKIFFCLLCFIVAGLFLLSWRRHAALGVDPKPDEGEWQNLARL